MIGSYSPLRVGIVQRVLTTYRRPFFERLASYPDITLSVFAGDPQPDEGVKTEDTLDGAELFHAINHHWTTPVGLLCWQSGLVDWLQAFDPQLLVLEASPRLLSHWLALVWMRYKRRPVIGWGLGELERSGPVMIQRARQRFSWLFVRSLDVMIAYSSKAKNDYIRAGVPADRIFVAFNSVDHTESEKYLALLGNDLTWVRPWKESLGFDPTLPIVLFVGRLVPQKRVDLLIEACAPLFDRCQLLVVGDGPLRDALEFQSLPYGKRILFTGHQSGEALARSFIASDVFVLPGAGGLAIHQAMSYGKPVIVSFGDGTELDLVREGQNGFFFRVGDASDLTTKLGLLLRDPDRIKQMGQTSLSIVRSEINLNKMADLFLQAFDYVLRSPGERTC
ncbi:MAG: glycosyltransferase family 4 protein [candidate division WOR-3 bacterium]